MRALVTGIAGYIAPFVADRLASDGYEVWATDVEQPKGGVVSAKFVRADLTDAESVMDLLGQARPDAICHLAACGDVYLAAQQPSYAMRAGPYLTARLLEGVAEYGRARGKMPHFVYTSTWEVYGEPEYEPMDEEHPTRPDHPYSAAKLAGEMAARCAGRLQGVPVTVLRLGSAYGPGMRGKSVFSIFIGRASQGQRLTVFGDGTQYRQWTHVRDIARGFAGALAQPEAAVGQTYNLVAPEKVTIGEMAQRIAERYGVELTYGPARPGDVPPALVSSEKAFRDLGWEAEIAFADGLAELLGRGTA